MQLSCKTGGGRISIGTFPIFWFWLKIGIIPIDSLSFCFDICFTKRVLGAFEQFFKTFSITYIMNKVLKKTLTIFSCLTILLVAKTLYAQEEIPDDGGGGTKSPFIKQCKNPDGDTISYGAGCGNGDSFCVANPC